MKKSIMFVSCLAAMLLPGLATAGAKRINVHIPFGNDNLIAINKPVSIQAQCVLDEGGSSVLRVYGITTAPTGTVQDGSDDWSGSGGSFLLPGAAANTADILTISTSVGGVNFGNDIDDGFILATVEGKGLATDGESAVLGIDATGCYLSMTVEKINKFKPLKPQQLPPT